MSRNGRTSVCHYLGDACHLARDRRRKHETAVAAALASGKRLRVIDGAAHNYSPKTRERIEREDRLLTSEVERCIRAAIPLTDEEIDELMTVYRKINGAAAGA